MRHKLAMASAAAIALWSVPAAAQQCRVAYLPANLCNAPALVVLDQKLQARERQVIEATGRAASWTADGVDFRAHIADIDYDGAPVPDADSIADRYTAQIARLEIAIAQAATVRDPATREQALGSECLAGWLRHQCSVPMSGILRGEGGVEILWQLQSGVSEEDGVGMGVLLWDASGGGTPRLIGWSFDAGMFRAPGWSDENNLLWVPGTLWGTGSGNADLLFQRREGKWVDIDITSWKAALEERLPPELSVWKGVRYYFDGMEAETSLWREDRDANCCPTGGTAIIRFRIEGDALVIDAVQAQLDGPGAEWKDF